MEQMIKEYAEALFMLAKENDAQEEYAVSLDTVLSIFKDDPEYLDFLASPNIPKAERIEAIGKAFDGVLPEYAVSFVQLLCEMGRIRGFDECVQEYKKLLDASRHVSKARVISTVSLTESELSRLKEKLEKMSGNTVVLECFTDETLLGGMIVEIDGKVIDGSLRHRLHEVKDVMSR